MLLKSKPAFVCARHRAARETDRGKSNVLDKQGKSQAHDHVGNGIIHLHATILLLREDSFDSHGRLSYHSVQRVAGQRREAGREYWCFLVTRFTFGRWVRIDRVVYMTLQIPKSLVNIYIFRQEHVNRKTGHILHSMKVCPSPKYEHIAQVNPSSHENFSRGRRHPPTHVCGVSV